MERMIPISFAVSRGSLEYQCNRERTYRTKPTSLMKLVVPFGIACCMCGICLSAHHLSSSCHGMIGAQETTLLICLPTLSQPSFDCTVHVFSDRALLDILLYHTTLERLLKRLSNPKFCGVSSISVSLLECCNERAQISLNILRIFRPSVLIGDGLAG